MTFGGLNPAALLALAAALSWTMAALFSHRPATELGSLHFNRLRMIAAVIIMAGMDFKSAAVGYARLIALLCPQHTPWDAGNLIGVAQPFQDQK